MRIGSMIVRDESGRGTWRLDALASCCAAALIACCPVGPVFAQAGGPAAPAVAPAAAPAPATGWQIASASAYGVYYSTSLPSNGFALQPNAVSLPSDWGGGASFTVNWLKITERTTFSLTYTPSYTADLRYSSLDALNHSFSLNAARKLTPRWTFNFAVAANLSQYQEEVFAPTNLSTVAATPANFQDLAAGLLSGQFANNPRLGVALTNPQLVESALSPLLYGERMLTASGSASLSYSLSPRSTISFNGTSNRTQDVQGQPATGVNAYLLPLTTTVSAGSSFSYSLSPVTQLTASVTSSRTLSGLWDGYVTTSQANLGHSWGDHWVMQVHAGVAALNIVRQLRAGPPIGPQPAAGGSLAYKTMNQTFLGSYDRVSADTYGLGAATTSLANAAWEWRRPGNSWWLDASFGWQQLSGNGLGTISGWRVSASLNRALGTRAVLVTQYVYSTYSGYTTYAGGLPGGQQSSAQNAVRVAVTWIPHPPTLQQ